MSERPARPRRRRRSGPDALLKDLVDEWLTDEWPVDDGASSAPTQGPGGRQVKILRIHGSPEASELNPDAEVVARRAARLEDDRMRFAALVEAGFKGAAWENVSDDLWVYGWAVLSAGLQSGKAFAWAARRGIVINSTFDERRVLTRSADDRDEIVTNTLLRSVVGFRDNVLKKGLWHPKRENAASLRTFFVGYCFQHLSVMVRRWRTTRARELQTLGFGTSAPELARVIGDGFGLSPQAQLETAELLDRLLQNARDETRMICLLVQQGYTQPEIAEQLGLTTRTVEGQMRRLRLRAQRMTSRGQIKRPAFLDGEAS